MKDKILKIIPAAIFLTLAIAFIVKFGGRAILKSYIETGIGDCRKIPILCMAPSEEINNLEIDKEYIAGLLEYKFPKIDISIPKGFDIFQEKIKKTYYKKFPRRNRGSAIYIIHMEPDFFVSLFPEIRKQGTNSDFDFMKRTMYAKESDIKNHTDAFFVIMKSIFIPDLGAQKNVKMAQFSISDKRGFINYNLSGPDRYFDCIVFNGQSNFFAIYIKDKGGSLDLNKVLSIISTAKAR